jgi:hypothetical protein
MTLRQESGTLSTVKNILKLINPVVARGTKKDIYGVSQSLHNTKIL